VKVIITSGATREHIDTIRFISNISTGRLGALMAETAAAEGFDILYIHGAGAVLPQELPSIRLFPVISAEDARLALEECLKDPEVRAVIHPMAVSDYTPSIPETGKLSSNAEELVLTLKPTPKLVRSIKKHRPDVLLVMFKLESGLARDELIDRARRSMEAAQADLAVANLVERTGEEDHTALLLDRETVLAEATGKTEIAASVMSFVTQHLT
jgi:phosphopantothenoylcysteine synthetase/decarboxylase